MMEDLNLTETESRYFGDLFLCCDEESNGKIPILKATELFRSSNIANDVLKQIMDVSVAPNNSASLNHMNRKQFYSALKLIAAHQSNIAIKQDLLSTPLDLPLPRFTWALNSEASSDLIQLSSSPKEQHITKRERNFPANLGAYEPIRVSSNMSDSDVPQTLSHDNTEPLSTDSEMESETLSQHSDRSHGHRGKSGSPWSTASDSPTPTNSVAEKPHPVWEHSATGRGVWPTNTAEEHTQLLGTEEESSDRHSSEEETETGDDGWAISDAAARHYATQFTQLRPDRGLLPGHTARLFFEKSRLSVTDLRKIWQLSDITKDGSLSLEEFSIAMHLIVMRRNNIPVPEALPACLVPKIDSRYSQRAVTTDLVDLGVDMFGSGTSADFNFAPKSDTTGDPYEAAQPTKRDDYPPTTTPPKPESQTNNREWTKFVDSPTSSLSSPGPKPVNFDFHKSAVERDPKIHHPVALRVTPDAGSLPRDERASASPRRDEFALAFEAPAPSPKRSEPPAAAPAPELRSIQRPQPKKPAKSAAAGALPPPPAREPPDAPPARKEPPPPPPRPLRQHARSSSLDLTRLAPASAPAPAPPPQPPPPPPYDGSALGARRGAFEVYRKGPTPGPPPEPDAKALQEQNAVLHRVCRALQAELADVQRDRDALRLLLDAHSTAV